MSRLGSTIVREVAEKGQTNGTCTGIDRDWRGSTGPCRGVGGDDFGDDDFGDFGGFDDFDF